MLWWFLIMGDEALCSAATEIFGVVWCEPGLSIGFSDEEIGTLNLHLKSTSISQAVGFSSSALWPRSTCPFPLVSRHWSHCVTPADSSDAPGLGCIWEGICPRGLYLAVVGVPVRITSLQIFNVMDLSVRVSIQRVATSGCLLVEVSLLREGSLLLQLLFVLVRSISNW